MRVIREACALAVCGSIVACNGNIGGGGSDKTGPVSAESAQEASVSGMRRLSVGEYRQTVTDLLGMAPANAREVLPVDTLVPFDNDYTIQTPSEALVKGAEMLSGDVADAVVADPSLRNPIVGCQPAGNTDDACFRSFVTSFGRRALRRPLAQDEIDAFAGLQKAGADAGDFWVGVNAALRAFLQHPEFLYRVEIGTPVDGHPGVFALNDFEVGTRLSYFLIGSSPPDWLLDAAAQGKLHTKEGVAAAANELLGDPRARARLADFHAMWLSYSQLGDTGLGADMHAETDALVNRIVFDEKRPWTDILTSTETFVTPALADHYGLPSPGATAGWVSYGDSGRKGIMSQGTFLSAVPKFGDTSPTQRGLLVRTRLFCQPIPKPAPNLMVNIDKPPAASDPNACKKQRYYMSNDPSCSGCHKLMDPIGFGLEAFDSTGKHRDAQPGRPDCPIDGQGSFEGIGDFNGPGQLADVLVGSGEVESCVVKQLYRFAVGRMALDEHDTAVVERLATDASKGGALRLGEAMSDYVTSDAFRLRREETMQ